MATVTGLTAERMLEIEGESVVSGTIDGSGHLILTTRDGTPIDAGVARGPAGPTGPMGPVGGMIPGEVRLWSSTVLPDEGTYGTWVWADGAVYANADHPLAAANIGSQWKTFDGAADPGAGNFRVPDLRGLVPAGLDQMPGGARANRMTRTVAITLATKTGEETHKIVTAEMASHGHSINSVGDHAHGYSGTDLVSMNMREGTGAYQNILVGFTHPTAVSNGGGAHGHSAGNTGGNTAHENVQPTVFVPYIVYLD